MGGQDLCQGGPWDEFDYECPSPEARTSLHMAGNRGREGDVNGVVHHGHSCRPMQGSATI